jgi:DNA-binding YbaB/EbfC family protein
MNIPGLEDLLRQAQSFGVKISEIREELAKEFVEGSAGGGMVVAEANGRGRIVRVKIEPKLIDQNDLEMLEDLVAAAVNQATDKAKQLAVSKMQSLTGGLPIPGLSDLFV